MSVGYVAYIDEAGDDGIRAPNASLSNTSQWMIISAVVVKATNEPQILQDFRNAVMSLEQHQMTHLHFRKLNDDKKAQICSKIAEMRIRAFVVLSHKRNMIGRRNLNAEKSMVNKTARFYCWMTRLLLEKVSEYCGRRTFKDYNENRSIRFEFSDRGGVDIDGIKNYYSYLREQSASGSMFIDKFDLDWSVIDVNEMHIHPNKMRVGLQIADVVASAFFSGLEPNPIDGTTKPEFAKLLLPRIAMLPNGRRYGFGVRTMPTWVPDLPSAQAELRDFYLTK